jgi:hypothetical protein
MCLDPNLAAELEISAGNLSYHLLHGVCVLYIILSNILDSLLVRYYFAATIL